MVPVQLKLNGRTVTVQVEPWETLLDVLRDRLGLTGTKCGCRHGECGACTVIFNGKTVNSCLVPVLKAQGAEVITIEGIGTRENLHPLQKSFVEHGAVQCGFCTPGMILQAKALLETNPQPSREEIMDALSGNLCRCTGYQQIIEAIGTVAHRGREADATGADSDRRFKVVGRPTPLIDAVEKVLGNTKFASDIKLPGMLYCRTLRSPHPMARVVRIDTSRAKTMPRVKAVLTAEDIPGPNLQGSIKLDQPVLVPVGGLAKYIGDPIALVAAEDEETAEKALGMIEVEYDVGKPITSVEYSTTTEEGQPELCCSYENTRGDVDRALESSEVVIEQEFYTGRQEHAYLEPEAGVAYIEDGIITVVAGTQAPHHVRRIAAYALGLPESRIRIKCPPTGGSFGGKQINSVQVHLALLAWKTGCSVKMVWSREESIAVHHKRHPASIRYRMGATREGRISAIAVDAIMDGGPYAEESPGVTNWLGMHIPGPYDIPNIRINVKTFYTNNPIAGAFRGFGAPQAAFATESMIDCLAHELHIDPVELRRKNISTQAYQLGVRGVVFDSPITADLVLEKALELAGEPLVPSRAENLVGRGVSCAMCLFDISAVPVRSMKGTGASVELCPDGSVIVRSGATDTGTGLGTVLAQIASEELGVPLMKIAVLTGDSALSPKAGPTIASRGTYTAGNAVKKAALALKERLIGKAAQELGVSPEDLCFCAGDICVAGKPDSKISLNDIALICHQDGVNTCAESWFMGTHAQWGHTFVATVADVEVDCSTGEVHVRRISLVHDSGRTLNPLGARGQHIGGIVQGLGYTLTENLPVQDGRILVRGLDSYLIPTSVDIPEEIRILPLETAYPTGPYGAKGLAEHALISVPAAISNAVFDATGYRCTEIPILPEKVLTYLRWR